VEPKKGMGTQLTAQQRAAFARMLHPHHRYLARFCLNLTACSEDGQDLYQQAILKALDKWGSLRDPDRFRQWLCSIIVNEHRNLCRKRRLQRLFLLSAQHDDNLGRSHSGPFTEPPDVAQTVRLRRCLARLSAKKREALVLFEVEGFSLADVAEIQDCSLQAVKKRVSRARTELRKLFVGGDKALIIPARKREENHGYVVGLETLKQARRTAGN
jgi:RNA polymerase sigma-70 factor (ECF subfamily)